ncbi:LysR family transcriptional regulator [Paenibacillus sp. GCM10023248]|uniref:LysR family transcriptional regulator n=1 Tax=unclassified Paenibacillus TaxID=185978 RepID=UPI0023784772|nr:LysR family transcriptional regulator [Paenibacillus sp. MAHUQ-63]MDD9268324.1 LysR family transcriptional regulator [Paenibacillus sp. MAHUQ-63]
MDFQLLKVFYTTAQEGSISKAASKLNFAQSNITHKIQQLEADLETTLFYRHRRGITLTPTGQILVDYAEKILHIVQEARMAVGDSAAPTGPLRIGSMETTAAVRLPILLTKYHRDYPDVDFTLTTGPTEKHIHAVLHYELNGAFVAGPVEHPELVQESVIDEELVLLTATSHPPVSSIKDVELRTLLAFPNGCSYRAKLIRLLDEEGIIPDKVMDFGSIETIIGCVGAGLGIALMPRSFVAEAAQQGRIRLHDVQDKYAIVPTVFIRRQDALMTPAFSAFLAEMRTHFR